MKATAEYRPDCASSISLLPTNGGLSPLICRSPARASLSAKIAPTSLSRAENQATAGLATPVRTGCRPERPRTERTTSCREVGSKHGRRPLGTSRPSVFTVLRLMTSSNLSANCTGRLAGATTNDHRYDTTLLSHYGVFDPANVCCGIVELGPPER